MAYLSSSSERRRRFSLSRVVSNADSLIGHAALVMSLVFVAALIVAL